MCCVTTTAARRALRIGMAAAERMQRDVLGWLGSARGVSRQCNRTASSKCQVRRISITSYSRARAGGNAG